MRRAVKFLLPAAVAALAFAPVQARAGGYIRPWGAPNAGNGFNNDKLGRRFSKRRVGMLTQVGVMGYFSDHFGLRGDVRYLRNLQNNSSSLTNVNFDPGNFHFWRASIGVVLR